jgi:hypothetical protein
MEFQTVPAGAKLSLELAEWVSLSIANAVVLFGRLEQELIEIAWLVKSADVVADRVRLSRSPASEHFGEIVGLVEKAEGRRFDELRKMFRTYLKIA